MSKLSRVKLIESFYFSLLALRDVSMNDGCVRYDIGRYAQSRKRPSRDREIRADSKIEFWETIKFCWPFASSTATSCPHPLSPRGRGTSLATHRNFNASADVPTLLIPSIVFFGQLFAITSCPLSLLSPRFHCRTDIDSTDRYCHGHSIYSILLFHYSNRGEGR